MEENIIISDEELIKYFSKKDLEDMATLFSKGQFKELLNNYFYIKKSDETKLNQDNNDKTGEELYNQYNKSNLLKEGKDDNQLEFNYAIFEKLLDNEFCQQIILTIVFPIKKLIIQSILELLPKKMLLQILLIIMISLKVSDIKI